MVSRPLGLGYGRGDKAVNRLHVVRGRGYRLDHVAVATRRRAPCQQVGDGSQPVGVGVVEMIGGLHRPRRDLFGIDVAVGVDNGIILFHGLSLDFFVKGNSAVKSEE